VAKTHFNSVRLNFQEVSIGQRILCAEVTTHHNITLNFILMIIECGLWTRQNFVARAGRPLRHGVLITVGGVDCVW